jgi:putative copper resistance protein D
MAGLAVIAAALLSPIDSYAEFMLSYHMGQHVLLTMVAAPLLALGAPVTLALAATSPSGGRRILLRFLHGRFLRIVASPVLGWVAFVVVMWGWHVPSLYDAALRNDGVHAVEHATLLAAALLFWWQVVGLDPNPVRISHPGRLFFLFLAMPAMAMLGLAISSADRILYPFYAVASPAIGVSPIADQRLAGALMWEGGLLLMMPAMVLVLFDWMRREERAAERADSRRRREEEAVAVAERLGGGGPR